MLTVVTFLWRRSGEARRYGAEHVNMLRRGLQRHLTQPHRMVCATNAPDGLDSDIVAIPLAQGLVDGAAKRTLKLILFRRDAAAIFGGSRLLYLDLDVTPVGDLDPLVDRTEDFVIWRDPLAGREGYEISHRYNSSLILMDAGCRPQVAETFDPACSLAAARQSGLVGSDQAWIGLTVGPGEAVWTRDDGVLGFRHDLDLAAAWPAGTRLIVSHGRPKPWELDPGHPLRAAHEGTPPPRPSSTRGEGEGPAPTPEAELR